MGTGIFDSKLVKHLSSLELDVGINNGSWSVSGTITPHSQFRQFSLGALVALSFTSLPHALSEQFADPMYVQCCVRADSISRCGRTKINYTRL